MKIAYVLDDTYDSADGVQQYIKLLGGWMTNKGHDVHCLVGESDNHASNIHSLAKNIKVNFNKNKLTIPIWSNSGAIKELLEAQQFDILHIQMPYSPIMSGKVIKYAPRDSKIVGTFHIAPHGRIENGSTKLLGIMQSRSLRKFNKIISVSGVASKFARDSLGLPSVVIPNAVDLTLYKNKKNVRKLYDVIFIGRLVERKGCSYLLKAIKELRQNGYESLKVAIVGRGEQQSKLKKYVSENNLNKNIKFFGYVSESKKRELLSKSKIAAFPATGGESFGIVLLEAMAAGCVVLAGDNPGYRGVMERERESLFNPKDYESLAEKIDYLLSKHKVMLRIYQNQQKILKQFDINIVGGDILQVYKQLVKDKHAK